MSNTENNQKQGESENNQKQEENHPWWDVLHWTKTALQTFGNYFCRKAGDCIDAYQSFKEGDIHKSFAHVVGYDEMLDINRDKRMGFYEKATRMALKATEGAVESVTDSCVPLGSGAISKYVVKPIGKHATASTLVQWAKDRDDQNAKSTLEKSLGKTFNSEQWSRFRDTLEDSVGKNAPYNDHRMDRVELQDALSRLDLNRDGKLDSKERDIFKNMTPNQLIAYMNAERLRPDVDQKKQNLNDADLFDLNNDGKVDRAEKQAWGSKEKMAAYFQKNGSARSA